MSEPSNFAPLQLCMMRVAALSSGGAPQPGAYGYITDSVMTAKIKLEIEAGDEVTVKNGCGNISQYSKSGDHVKGATITMELPTFDLTLLSLLIGNSTLVRDASGVGVGEAMGWRAPAVAAAAGNGVCLEMWSKAWDNTQQATPNTLGGTTAGYFHWVFPRVLFTLSDLPLGSDFTTTTVEGTVSENANLTVNGPWNDWPYDIARQGISEVVGVFYDAAMATLPATAVIQTVPATS